MKKHTCPPGCLTRALAGAASEEEHKKKFEAWLDAHVGMEAGGLVIEEAPLFNGEKQYRITRVH